MKDSYYFSHDSNARNDQRILKVRLNFGAKGYAIYFMIIEILRETKEYSLSIDDIDAIAFDIREDSETVKSVITDFELFKFDKNRFYSESLLNRMNKMNHIREIRQKAGKKGALAKQELSKAKANAEQMPSKPLALKEKKRKETKLNKRFIKPTLLEIQNHFKHLGHPDPPQISNKFYNHYESNGWKVGKNKMVSWKHAISNWNTTEKKENPNYANDSNYDYLKKKQRREDERNKRLQPASDDERSEILKNVNFSWEAK